MFQDYLHTPAMGIRQGEGTQTLYLSAWTFQVVAS